MDERRDNPIYKNIGRWLLILCSVLAISGLLMENVHKLVSFSGHHHGMSEHAHTHTTSSTNSDHDCCMPSIANTASVSDPATQEVAFVVRSFIPATVPSPLAVFVGNKSPPNI